MTVKVEQHHIDGSHVNFVDCPVARSVRETLNALYGKDLERGVIVAGYHVYVGRITTMDRTFSLHLARCYNIPHGVHNIVRDYVRGRGMQPFVFDLEGLERERVFARKMRHMPDGNENGSTVPATCGDCL